MTGSNPDKGEAIWVENPAKCWGLSKCLTILYPGILIVLNESRDWEYQLCGDYSRWEVRELLIYTFKSLPLSNYSNFMVSNHQIYLVIRYRYYQDINLLILTWISNYCSTFSDIFKQRQHKLGAEEAEENLVLCCFFVFQ